jgi:site-specific DNA-methyltransferase (adenine-specific)
MCCARYGPSACIWPSPPFPEELTYRLIKFYSYKGNVVLDPFGGTGTVAAVAAKTGRRFVHLDLSRKYCEIAAEQVATCSPDFA